MFKLIRELIERENKRINESRLGRGNSVLFGHDEILEIPEDLESDLQKIDDLFILHETDTELVKTFAEAIMELEKRICNIEDRLGIKRDYENNDFDGGF